MLDAFVTPLTRGFAARTLGLLGAAMSCGYLFEQEFRTAMTPTSLDPVTTPIAAAGFGLAVVMAVTGLRGLAQQQGESTRLYVVADVVRWVVKHGA